MLKEVLSSFDEFISRFPEYKETQILDELRKSDYSRLDTAKQIYLDYTGGNLYAERQVKQHLELLVSNTFGNPHSTNPTSQFSTHLVEKTREHVLKFFNAGDDYLCIFTPNASGALKIVGESYPFNPTSVFLLSIDNHNSVNGIREFAKGKGAEFMYVPVKSDSLELDEEALIEQLEHFGDKTNKLFAFPAQSNVSGMKHPLYLVEEARKRGWDILLDTAAFAPSNKLDLQAVKPDFASISFYKIFGYPTGLGCLLLRKDKFAKLVKPWYAGGTISLAAATYDGHYLAGNHERFEEGTVNYLDIPAIDIGLNYIESIGIDVIGKRVKCLTGWLISQLDRLVHDNGVPLIQIYGSKDLNKRGGTLFMNFYRPDGSKIPFSLIEDEANRENISIRTGCFCNPGLDEANNNISYKELEAYFTTHESGNFTDMVAFNGKLRGAVRVSVGLATNFNDVETFYRFASGFLNRN